LREQYAILYYFDAEKEVAKRGSIDLKGLPKIDLTRKMHCF